jgi:hypothetical protein
VGVSQRFSCGNLDPFFILGLRTRICNQAALGRSEGAAAADLFHWQLDVTQYAKCFFTSFLVRCFHYDRKWSGLWRKKSDFAHLVMFLRQKSIFDFYSFLLVEFQHA